MEVIFAIILTILYFVLLLYISKKKQEEDMEEYKHQCYVCKKNFKLEKEEKYIVSENKGVTGALSGYKKYECFDCPECGCQNVVNIRQ